MYNFFNRYNLIGKTILTFPPFCPFYIFYMDGKEITPIKVTAFAVIKKLCRHGGAHMIVHESESVHQRLILHFSEF